MSHPEWQRHLFALGLGMLLPLASAMACGPDFPYRLLEDRENALAQLPEGSFSNEVRLFGNPVAGLGQASDATLTQYWGNAERLPVQRDEIEKAQLSDGRYERVQHLRSLADAHQAEREGADLSAELRLYTAGAVAFAQGDASLAAEYFNRVLALPGAERQLRSTWAAYSLGRSLARIAVGATDPVLGDEQRQHDYREQARRAFEQTRELTVAGFDDPLELAIASLGEQARLDLAERNWSQAIQLYASQSIHRSETGTSSLQEVSASLSALSDEELLPLLRQPAVRQLLTASLLANLGNQALSASRLLALIQRAGIERLDDADRLAALAYRQGDYVATQRFLEHADDSGLGWWLKAKMALRAGDKAAASLAYAQAAKRFPDEESWGLRRSGDWLYESVKPKCRIEGESAILAMERGDYLEAFDQLYRSGELYWQDAAAVAERVLASDELKGYVDSHVPSVPSVKAGERVDSWSRQPAMELRELLARRLMRDGRYSEAIPYFAHLDLQEAARHYQNALQEANSAWTDIGRAEGYFQAARIARRHGMELLGYELGPDNRVYDGNFGNDEASGSLPIKAAALLSADEAQRWNATTAKPYRRYHYRWIAADLASRAADLVPERSQAFATTLCAATDWMINVDPEKAQGYFQRYIDHGALRRPLDTAFVFGVGACEEPDFDRARDRLWVERGQAIRDAVRSNRYALGVGLLAAVAAAIYWRRRRAGLAIVDKTAEDNRHE
ncbi:hypothetical protein [Pseudomonas sp. LRF_L74]|uniref:hypothetical protein n=1 Tax=Pseudomonas sp. LRF_L74 TaxID=3369422 RepID=UPI003F5ED988